MGDLSRLAVGNRANPDRIAAELAQDNTANGKKFAAAALAAISTPEAKLEAWTELTERTEYSNTLISSASQVSGECLTPSC